MACDKTAEPKLIPLIIYDPPADSEATIDSYYGDLCFASGQAAGTQIAGIYAVCEQLADEHAPITYNADHARNQGIFVSYYNSWTATHIPGAHVGWNALIVGVFYYGYPAAPTVTETRRFQGVSGNCSQSSMALPSMELLRGATTEAATGAATLGHLAEVIDNRPALDVKNRAVLHEPADRDGDWLLYRDLPVHFALGDVLALEGKPLRATVISLAVESLIIRRTIPPAVDVRTPFGTGEVAWEARPTPQFRGFPLFGTVIHQRGHQYHPPYKVSQLITSTSRANPMPMGVDPTRPIYVAVNSPRAEEFLNEGQIDLWVRVDAR